MSEKTTETGQQPAAPDQQLAAHLDTLLPQTQCGRCGYPGCLAYAQALAAGESADRCAPGGEDTARALAEALDRSYAPVQGQRREDMHLEVVARIREEDCIGCTKCIQACPTSAIVGALHFSHSVISAACTGCDLCLPPCPTDCIDLVPVAPTFEPDLSRDLFAARERRRLAAVAEPVALRHLAPGQVERPVSGRAERPVPQAQNNAMLAVRIAKTRAALERARAQNHPAVADLEAALAQLQAPSGRQQQPQPAPQTPPSQRAVTAAERQSEPRPTADKKRQNNWRQPPEVDRLP